MDSLEITNFAIDCTSIKAAIRAANASEVVSILGEDLFFGLCWLNDESRAAWERPIQTTSERKYKEAYRARIQDSLPDLLTALHVTRDIFGSLKLASIQRPN